LALLRGFYDGKNMKGVTAEDVLPSGLKRCEVLSLSGMANTVSNLIKALTSP
jgi:hypothetical protein